MPACQDLLSTVLTRVLCHTGNARIQGMTTDLHMTGHDYNIALFIFFIPVSVSNQKQCTWTPFADNCSRPKYILFEIPSNMIVKRVAPSTWLSVIMVLWGMHGMLRTRVAILTCPHRYSHSWPGPGTKRRPAHCLQILARLVRSWLVSWYVLLALTRAASVFV